LTRAKRKLGKFKGDLERADTSKDNTSFAKDDYIEMFNREAEERDGLDFCGSASTRFVSLVIFKSQYTDAC